MTPVGEETESCINKLGMQYFINLNHISVRGTGIFMFQCFGWARCGSLDP